MSLPQSLNEAAAEHIIDYANTLDSEVWHDEVASWELESTQVINNCPVVYNGCEDGVVYFDVIEQ